MSPAKRKEKLIQISKTNFRKALAESNVSQKEIAEQLLFTSEAYLSRKLAAGSIDKEWLYKIADYLNVSRSYLTGESEEFITRLAERRNEITSSDAKALLTEFMISKGFSADYCDSLTDSDLDHIAEFISGVVTTHENIILNMVNNTLALEKHIAELEKRMQALEDNSSHKD